MVMQNNKRRPALIATAVVLLSSLNVESLLLYELPTPSFVIDTQALRRIAIAPTASNDASTQLVPSIRLPDSGALFRPHPIKSLVIDSEFASTVVDVTFPVEEGQASIGFIHSTVTLASEDATPDGDSIATFLAEIDSDPSLCGRHKDELGQFAKLVLGLNNHHVGSYYWARSAGTGASMEAPGVLFGCSPSGNDRGALRWIDERGPALCNSNDGKRSEWVNFLRKGDTVQLVPVDGQGAMLQMSKSFGSDGTNGTGRLFGISSEGRPMGSEPEVVCEWRQANK